MSFDSNVNSDVKLLNSKSRQNTDLISMESKNECGIDQEEDLFDDAMWVWRWI